MGKLNTPPNKNNLADIDEIENGESYRGPQHATKFALWSDHPQLGYGYPQKHPFVPFFSFLNNQPTAYPKRPINTCNSSIGAFSAKEVPFGG